MGSRRYVGGSPSAGLGRAISLGIFLFAATANAQAPATGGNPADTQFDYGLAEMQAGRYETGCAALAESYRLDPKPGSLFTLAECESRWGKLAIALTHYDAYLDIFSRMTPEQQAKQKGRERIANSKRDELRAKVPTLAVSLARGSALGTTVKRDGVPIGGPTLGVPVPVEVGEHVIEVQVPGRPVRIERVVIGPGKSSRIVVDGRDADATPVVDPPEDPPPSPDSESLVQRVEHRPPALASAAIGGLGLVIGIIGGIVTIGHKGTIDSHCVGTTCDSEGKHAGDAAQTTGAISTIGFVIAGLGVGASLLFAYLTPPRTQATVVIAPNHAGLDVVHRF